jgi:hypothetical protein
LHSIHSSVNMGCFKNAPYPLRVNHSGDFFTSVVFQNYQHTDVYHVLVCANLAVPSCRSTAAACPAYSVGQTSVYAVLSPKHRAKYCVAPTILRSKHFVVGNHSIPHTLIIIHQDVLLSWWYIPGLLNSRYWLRNLFFLSLVFFFFIVVIAR